MRLRFIIAVDFEPNVNYLYVIWKEFNFIPIEGMEFQLCGMDEGLVAVAVKFLEADPAEARMESYWQVDLRDCLGNQFRTWEPTKEQQAMLAAAGWERQN
ncbi:MAG: hypothetical protein Q7R88_01995 [bacterium]|nr:hypothetical protein [bacterium]